MQIVYHPSRVEWEQVIRRPAVDEGTLLLEPKVIRACWMRSALRATTGYAN